MKVVPAGCLDKESVCACQRLALQDPPFHSMTSGLLDFFSQSAGVFLHYFNVLSCQLFQTYCWQCVSLSALTLFKNSVELYLVLHLHKCLTIPFGGHTTTRLASLPLWASPEFLLPGTWLHGESTSSCLFCTPPRLPQSFLRLRVGVVGPCWVMVTMVTGMSTLSFRECFNWAGNVAWFFQCPSRINLRDISPIIP